MEGQIAVNQSMIDLESVYQQSKRLLITRSSKPMNRNPMKITPKHEEIVNLVCTSIGKRREFIIAIDGVDGAGKSSLARYLAWQLNVSVIETDLCRKQSTSQTAPNILNGTIPPIETDPEILCRLIQARHKMGNPVIVEGIFVLQSLEDAGVKPDVLMLIKKSGWNGSFDFTAYNEKFSDSIPDFEFIWSDGGSHT